MPVARPVRPPARNGPTRAPAPSGSPWDLVNSVHALVYGQSGTGKTTFASTFPDPLLWLICSGGQRPGELKSIDTPANRKRITPVVVTSFDHAKQVIADEAPKFATTVLDHASGFADLILSDIIGRPVPAQKGWGLASQQQYGQLGLQCKEAFRDLLNLAGHVVILAQERTFGGRDEGGDPELVKPTVGAALTPSVTGWLNPACDYVVQTFKRARTKETVEDVDGEKVTLVERVKGVDYCLRCEPHDVFMTKFRCPLGTRVPDVIVNPTYDKLVKASRGELK